MNTINKRDNIKIYWKIFRGVNKITENFDSTNLRVFVVGTDNTYWLKPTINKSIEPNYEVLEMNISGGKLETGVYDIKAIWQKNGGRHTLMSARTGVFAITNNYRESNDEKVISLASYVESYGRDGMSAYEIAVMRNKVDDSVSEQDWIDNMVSGGIGDGSISGEKLSDGTVSKEKLDRTLQGKIDLVDELDRTVNTKHAVVISNHSTQIEKIKKELEGGVGKPVTEVDVTVDNTTGIPSAEASIQGSTLEINFTGLKGKDGTNGIKGDKGDKGDPGITSAVVSVDDSSGTPFATASISDGVLNIKFSGLKGAQGNTGVTTDSFEIVNNLTEGGADKGLSAEMGKELSEKVGSLLGYTKEFRQDDENISQYEIDVKSNFKVGDVLNYTISNISNSEIKYLTLDLINSGGQHITYDYAINSPAKQMLITDDADKIRITSYSDYGSTRANTAYSFNVNAEGSAENLSNKVTELNENSTDIQYPSAACVYKELSSINNLMGASYNIENNDENKYNARIAFANPIKAGTRLKFIMKEYEAEKAPYFLYTIYHPDGTYSQIGVYDIDGKYLDEVLTLKKNVTSITIVSTIDYGGTMYNAKFKVEVQVEGLKGKVDNTNLYTPNDSFIDNGSNFKGKLTALDAITRPQDHDYTLKNESYRKIEVKSQAEFENLASLITEASKNSNNIDVNIAEGTYMIKDVMLDASQITNNACRIAISGSNVKILGNNVSYTRSEALYSTGTHNVFTLKEDPTIGDTIFTDGNDYIPISESGFSVASGAESFITPIVSANSANNEWKAQLPNRYSDMFGKTSGFENMRLWYACQWTGRLCEISKIDSAGYIYFKDKDNSPSPGADINPSRFVLINNEPTSEGVYFDNNHIYIPIKYNTIYQHKESILLKGTVNAASIIICGLNCVGVRYVVSGVINNTLISDCRFTSSRGFSEGTDNSPLQHYCKLCNCILEDFYSPKVFVYGNNTIIENNRFERLFRMQTGMPLAILLCGNGTAYCGKNKFIDMASEAIWSGLFYTGRTKESNYNTFRNIIEYNEIYQTKDFKYDRYSCYDAGAIYIATNACNPIVRYNYIHDIKGYVTHGIYCDDGAYGCSIYKNIICNIMDGYSINSRIVKKAQLDSMGRDTDGYPSNVDNLCMHNLINAPYLFRGSTEYTQYANGASRENNGCCCAKNLRMEMLLGISKYETLVDNINEFEDDINSKGSKSADGVIKIGANISSWEMPSIFNGLIKYYTI